MKSGINIRKEEINIITAHMIIYLKSIQKETGKLLKLKEFI
jgi:hypothetical protein